MSDHTVNDDLLRNFNLLNSSPAFALNVRADGSASVSTPPDIPAGSGIWLVHGQSHLADGSQVDSVFQIDTDRAGDTLMHAWWKTPQGWCSTSDQPRLFDVMGRPRDVLFPCRFETTIPLGTGLSLL